MLWRWFLHFVVLLVLMYALTDKEADDIPLMNVKASMLKKVVEYMKHHATNPPKEIEKVNTYSVAVSNHCIVFCCEGSRFVVICVCVCVLLS
jgi:hypothetical protein